MTKMFQSIKYLPWKGLQKLGCYLIKTQININSSLNYKQLFLKPKWCLACNVHMVYIVWSSRSNFTQFRLNWRKVFQFAGLGPVAALLCCMSGVDQKNEVSPAGARPD